MTHPRIAIRAAIKAQLLARASLRAIVGDRVYTSRYKDLAAEREIPAIRIYTHSEEVDADSWSTAPREYARKLDVAIEAVVRVPNSKADNLADRMDDLAWEIELAMGADDTLATNVSDVNLKNTTIDVDIEGENTAGIATLIFTAEYTSYPSPDPAEFDNFDEAFVSYDVAGGEQDPADRLRDELTNIHES